MKGRKSKGKTIEDNFNPDKMNADRLSELEARRAAALSNGTSGDSSKTKPEFNDDFVKTAYQMLQDMRWAYNMSDGRERLLRLIKNDDRQFVAMVKELLKLEAALIGSKKESGQTNQMVFVVLKGLEDEKTLVPQIAGINMRQITNAINPDGTEYNS